MTAEQAQACALDELDAQLLGGLALQDSVYAAASAGVPRGDTDRLSVAYGDGHGAHEDHVHLQTPNSSEGQAEAAAPGDVKIRVWPSRSAIVLAVMKDPWRYVGTPRAFMAPDEFNQLIADTIVQLIGEHEAAHENWCGKVDRDPRLSRPLVRCTCKASTPVLEVL